MSLPILCDPDQHQHEIIIHIISYLSEIKMEVTYSDLIMGNRIGQGACSSVNMARHAETGEMFAVKMFNVYDEVLTFILFSVDIIEFNCPFFCIKVL